MKKYVAVAIINEDLETMTDLGVYNFKEDAERAIEIAIKEWNRSGSDYELYFTKVLEIEC